MEIRDNNYIIYQSSPTSVRKTPEKEKEISSLNPEHINEQMTSMVNFYKDANFSPVTEKPIRVKPEAPLTVKTESVVIADSKTQEKKDVDKTAMEKTKNAVTPQISGKTEEKKDSDKIECKKPGVEITETEAKVLTEKRGYVKIDDEFLKKLENSVDINQNSMENLQDKLSKEKLDLLNNKVKDKNFTKEELGKRLEELKFSKEEIALITREGKTIPKDKLNLMEKLKGQEVSKEELGKKLTELNFNKEEIDIAKKQNILTKDKVIKLDQYDGIHELKWLRMDKDSLEKLKSALPEDKYKIAEGLKNKDFSKEELNSELVKNNFSKDEIKKVMDNIHQIKGKTEIEGAPNYRTTKGITGTGQPTIEAMDKILEKSTDGKKKKVKWVSFREEPVIYIDGKPCSLRKKDSVGKNIENPGINADQIERQETEFKEEILEEAKRNGGYILIQDEKIRTDSNGNVIKNAKGEPVIDPVYRKVQVSDDTIKTTKDVFNDMKNKGYDVEYKRIPVSDEKPMDKEDIDKFTETIKNDDPNMPLIVNCHAGRGRTTTGMVIADLTREQKKGTFTAEKLLRLKTFRDLFREFAQNPEGEGKRLRSVLSLVDAVNQAKTPQDVDKIINTIKDTSASTVNEEKANEAIDNTGQVQNLREATIKQLEKLKTDPKAKDKAVDFLKRYFELLAFQKYVADEGPKGFKQPFSEWLDNNKSLNDMGNNLKLALANPPKDGSTVTV